jgi:CRP-like cAMP-binding protein
MKPHEEGVKMIAGTLPEIILALHQVPFFSGLSDRELTPLATHCRRRQYHRNQAIVHQDDPGDSLYVVLSGRVRIVLPSVEGEDIVLVVFAPGDCFGELSLLDGKPRSATAVAQDACEMLTLGRSEFLEHVASHPAVALKVLQTLSARLRRTNILLADFAFMDLPARLVKRLLELACPSGKQVDPHVPVSVQITQAELASLVGSRRESVNKELHALAQRGFLIVERGRIVIKDPEALGRSFA